MHAYIKRLLLHSCTMHFTQAHTVVMHINYGLRAQIWKCLHSISQLTKVMTILLLAFPALVESLNTTSIDALPSKNQAPY